MKKGLYAPSCPFLVELSHGSMMQNCSAENVQRPQALFQALTEINPSISASISDHGPWDIARKALVKIDPTRRACLGHDQPTQPGNFCIYSKTVTGVLLS